jgi:hypothetical protein
MDGIPEINRNQQAQAETNPNAAGAPPAPTEVKIRTMRADLAGLAASGGGLPRFENVKVAGLSLEKKMDSAASHKSGALTAIIITAIAVIVLGALGYFAYKILAGGGF